MKIETNSQAHQDASALKVFGKGKRYLDVGSWKPFEVSDTWLLEQNGWHGICIDIHPFDYTPRNTVFIQSRAVNVFQEIELGAFDYISLDVDEATLESGKAMLDSGVTFKFATVEHDYYVHGDKYKTPLFELLNSYGYVRVFDNVHPSGWEEAVFEDWWCHPSICDSTLGTMISSLDAYNLLPSL